MSTDDKKAYQLGYAAGRRRTEAEIEQIRREREASSAAIQQQRLMVFCAALQGLLSSPKRWLVNGEPVQNATEYTSLAKKFVDQAYVQQVIR